MGRRRMILGFREEQVELEELVELVDPLVPGAKTARRHVVHMQERGRGAIRVLTHGTWRVAGVQESLVRPGIVLHQPEENDLAMRRICCGC
jgi:hypothetical protein